jgi:NhaP-type Na+/H+ or K+/H+ antiporter
MELALWFLVIGAMLSLMALAGAVLERLPLSAALLYLATGVLLGPLGLGLHVFDPLSQSIAVERLAENAVTVSLFSAGLKLRTPLTDTAWRLPIRLASLSMMATVGLIALVGRYALGLPWGGAVLLGAVLAPTDPVLASDVQVDEPTDRDRLRFGLTGEAGFNDGTAFPFVMLGLGLLGLHEIGDNGVRWLLVDVLWAVPAGLAIGAVLGAATGRLVVYLRREHREAVGLDDFLALGLVSLAYGAALLANAYAFLAAFAAGLALRAVERRAGGDQPGEMLAAAAEVGEEDEVAVDHETAPAYMASAVLGFSEQLERIGEVALVVLVGALLSYADWSWNAVWFVPLVLLVIRPLAVHVGLWGARVKPLERGLMSWFGIRGIGSVYYLMFAENHGLPDGVAWRLLALVLTTIAVSVVVHGTSVTPLMAWYRRRSGGG